MEISIGEQRADYLGECRRKGLSKNTLAHYTTALSKFEQWASARAITQLEQVTRVVLREYAEEIGKTLAVGGVHARLRVLRAFFKWLEAEEVISKNPMERVKLPKLPQQILPSVDGEHVEALFLAAKISRHPLRNAAVIGLLYDTGLRASELCGVCVADVKAGRLEVKQAKGGKARVVPVSRQALRLVRRYLTSERPSRRIAACRR